MRRLIRNVMICALAGVLFLALASIDDDLNAPAPRFAWQDEDVPLAARFLQNVAELPLFGGFGWVGKPDRISGTRVQQGYDLGQQADASLLQHELAGWADFGQSSIVWKILDRPLTKDEQTRYGEFFKGYVAGLQDQFDDIHRMHSMGIPEIDRTATPFYVQLGMRHNTCDPDGCRLYVFVRPPLDV